MANDQIKKEGQEKKTYELAVLLKTEGDFARVAEIVKQHSGELVGEPRLKSIALSYKIKKHAEAIFCSCFFQALPPDAKSLEDDLQTRDVAIRFMILASPAESSRPSVIPSFGDEGRRKPVGPGMAAAAAPREPREPKPAAREPLSNEALEKLLEKI